MKAIPRITADFDEYPELRVVAEVVVRRVVELMELHDIASIRRIRKIGIFDRKYDKDVVTPIGGEVPRSIAAVRHSAGKALLDYLDTVGIEGISLELTPEDVKTISSVWKPQNKQDVPASPASDDLTPKKVGDEKQEKDDSVEPQKKE